MISPIVPLWLIIPIIIFIVFISLHSRGLKLMIRIIMIILLFVINLRIKIPNGEVTVLKNNLDVIFVVDTTLSMDALDYNGKTRMSAVKKDLKYIIDQLPGATYSVISFDSITSIMPLTSDNNAVSSFISTMKVPDSLYAKGSTITIFKDDLKRILESSKKKTDKKRIVFIVSDGENTTDEKLESLQDLKDNIDGGAVLGYGTEDGGKIKVETYSGSGTYEYLKDTSNYPYKDAVSVIDEDNLRKMASDLKIDYIHMEKQKNINSKLKEINQTKEYSDEDKEYSYQDTYYFISPILIILLLAELAVDRRMHR